MEEVKNFENFLKCSQNYKRNTNSSDIDSVKILETNVDDVSGEILGNLIEKVMKKGAKMFQYFHGITKKEDPQILLLLFVMNRKCE